MKKKMYIEICLQHKEEIEKAIEFNAKNNYKYILKDDNNIIFYDNLAYLLRIGYTLNIYADTLELRHKNYNFENENLE